MNTTSYHVLGIMSGTSRDGIDLAEITFNFKNGFFSYNFGKTKTLAYSEKWRKTLAEADQFSKTEIENLDVKYTAYLAQQIQYFIKNENIKNLAAVCSHGHTIFHQPENLYTLQIGNRPELAKLLNLKVVCDFRIQDVLKGGQGAPLVPIGDKLLFSEFSACINLGGFSNISLEKNKQRIAYDICPFNIVLNYYAERLGFPYDDQGKIAESGKVNSKLLNHLNQLEFYQLPAPKSLGKEWVREKIFPVLENSNLAEKDILATFSEHISQQLLSAINHSPKGKILLTGGGAYNNFIINKVKSLSKSEIIIPSEKLINYKEALIFGLLGVLKLRGEINVLKSVTGAKENHSAGKIFLP